MRHKEAVQDLMRVKEMQPDNKQAASAVERCLKFIKEHGDTEFSVPVYADPALAAEKLVPDIPLPLLEGVKSAEELFEEAKKKREARAERQKQEE